ncbi:MAG: RNA 2',3'-cyclic phosphodiesterase [Syntrophothermus sp.]
MKRLFIAIKTQPDDGFVEQFRDLKRSLRHEKIKWVEENNIHITLKFLGETDEKLIPGINKVLEKTASGCSPFSFALKKTGIFGSSYAPKVIWVGIEPYLQLVALMKKVHQDLQQAGFEPDRQNLVPHLTLGRIKFLQDKKLFQDILAGHSDLASEPMQANGFHLFESDLRKEGPVYTSLKYFGFKSDR